MKKPMISYTNIILLFVLVISLIFNIYFVFQSINLNNKIRTLNEEVTLLQDKSSLLSSKVFDYLDLIGRPCDISEKDVDTVTNCLKNLVERINLKPTLRESSFHNAPPITDTQGHQILVYEGVVGYSLDSDGFKLYINKNLEDDGCEQEGKIDPGYTCKLTFNTACYNGDVMVVNYYNEEVFRKIC